MAKIARVRKIIMVVLILSAAVWLVVYSFKIKAFRRVKLKYLLIYAITLLLSLALAWIY
jgi:hypothetical protein